MATQTNPFDIDSNSKGGIIGGAMTNATDTTAAQYTAQQREINRGTETSAGQLDSILAKDSPLMQRARTQALQDMNARGLVNSSMSQGAAVAAMIDRATPIAQQDAQLYSNRAEANMRAVNDAGMFNAGEQNKFGLQLGEQAFTKSENEAGRKFATSERMGSQAFTAEQTLLTQQFQSAQNELDRALQQSLSDDSIEAQERLERARQVFTSAESALDRANQKALQESQQAFQGTQNNLDRQQQYQLQIASQTFQATENEKNRAAEIMLADKNITASMALERARQEFQGTQNALDRTQQTELANLNITAQKELQTAQQNFQSAQNELDRAQQKVLSDDSIEAQKELQAAQQTFQSAQNELDRTQQTLIADKNIDAQATLQTNQQQFQALQNQLDRDQQEAIVTLQDTLNNATFSKNYAANLSTMTLNAINTIQADPNLDATAKKGAIQNVIDSANASMQWGATFYNTDLPKIGTPGTTEPPGTVAPGEGSPVSAPSAQDVASVYQELLGRAPDQEGLQYWLNSGLSLDQIKEAVGRSPEAINYVSGDSGP